MPVAIRDFCTDNTRVGGQFNPILIWMKLMHVQHRHSVCIPYPLKHSRRARQARVQLRWLLSGLLIWSQLFSLTLTGIAQDMEPLPAAKNPHKYTNQLINETSPYLLQHAHNPVNWYPWGEEAFAKAKRENKPVFLSVGYSTCYWCHVMEKESFEDPEVAAVLNKHCIAIKVDREERPDIDEQYMLATQLINQRGGWPNSVWLTPDGKPWMAGTYFPKDRFISVLDQLGDIWKTRRDEVDRQAEALAQASEQANQPPAGDDVSLSHDLVDRAAQAFAKRFDRLHGGFGDAPKFPPHGILQLLIRQYQVSKDPVLLRPVTDTLDAMWRGGIHDHVGGGFHRYSTDAQWLLPHFEKMLYDNAQLLRAYTDGYQLTQNPTYKAAVADIFGWVQREMTSPEGAFYSALDSGEVGKEGEAYVWSLKKLNEVLSPDESQLYAAIYHFEEAGNFLEESTGHRIGTNIPHLKQPLSEIAKQHGLTVDELQQQLTDIRVKLLKERLTWPQPHKDDKVLTSWNALMIGALAHAGDVLQEPKYTAAAAKAADFILTSMVRDGQLQRSYRKGQARLPGFLDDYAYFIEALLNLHQATGDARWLASAEQFAKILLDDFRDPIRGDFFFTTSNHEDLLVRSRHLTGGGNMPNPNGVAAQALVTLAQRTNNAAYRQAAEKTLQSLAGMMFQQPHASEDLLVATSRLLADGATDTPQIADAGRLTKRVPPVLISVQAEPIAAANAADPNAAEASADQPFLVTVTLDIDPGWHLYGDNPDADFLQPSSVVANVHPQLVIGEVQKPTPERSVDPILKRELNTYAGQIRFRIPVTRKPAADDATSEPPQLSLTIVTQACDSSRCLPPVTTNLQISLPAGKAR